MADSVTSSGGDLMQALKTRMRWQQSRQKLLSENVANADTPGFRPLDLKAPSLSGSQGGVTLARTDAGHIGPQGSGRGSFDNRNASRFEVTPNGNGVNLEDEMMKVAQNQSDYQLATSLYTKGLGLVKIAIGKGR